MSRVKTTTAGWLFLFSACKLRITNSVEWPKNTKLSISNPIHLRETKIQFETGFSLVSGLRSNFCNY